MIIHNFIEARGIPLLADQFSPNKSRQTYIGSQVDSRTGRVLAYYHRFV